MDIHSSAPGKVIQSPQGYPTYVPNPLPPAIGWNDQLANALSRANYALGQLSSEAHRPPNPHLLIHPFVAREAVLSSKIEGTHTTVSEILAHDAGAWPKHQDSLQEVKNYILALDFGLKRLNELPLSIRLIKEVHQKLMQGVRGGHADPGELRRTQNWIGVPGSTLKTATFVPPSVDYLPDCLSDLEKFLHDRQLPTLIHIALSHYQFEAIHPFLDGNGRVGRLLITLLFIERQVLPSPILYLSAFFEATRDEYYRQLSNVSSKGLWQDWFLYFLSGVAVQSEDVLSRSQRINDLLNQWKLQVTGGTRVPMDIVEHLAENPFLTIKKTSQRLKISYTSAERGVKKLLDKKIINQVGESKRHRVYCASEILSILEEPAKVHAGPEET